jgi:hypothetical protein
MWWDERPDLHDDLRVAAQRDRSRRATPPAAVDIDADRP